MDLSAQIAHVKSILHAVPHERYGFINIVTFAHDSPEIDKLKGEVAKGIVESQNAQGHIADPSGIKPEATRQIRVMCRSCGTPLFVGMTDHDGGVSVGGPELLQHMSQMSLECPHKPFTAEDLRLHIQESVE